MDLWRLFALLCSVQVEIRVELSSEYCRHKRLCGTHIMRSQVDLWRLYCHAPCKLRFVSSCQVSIVGTMWPAEKAER